METFKNLTEEELKEVSGGFGLVPLMIAAGYYTAAVIDHYN